MFAGSRIYMLSFGFFCLTLSVSGVEIHAQELKNPELSPAQNCREEKHAVARMNCFAELAVQENDVLFCDGATSEAMKYKCYGVYAKRKSRSEVCRMVPDEEVKEGCLSSLAEKTGDQTLCEEIKTLRHKDSCYSRVVTKTGEIALCGKIGDRMQQMICSGSYGQ